MSYIEHQCLKQKTQNSRVLINIFDILIVASNTGRWFKPPSKLQSFQLEKTGNHLHDYRQERSSQFLHEVYTNPRIFNSLATVTRSKGKKVKAGHTDVKERVQGEYCHSCTSCKTTYERWIHHTWGCFLISLLPANMFSLSSHLLVASAAGELQQGQIKRKTDHEILISFAVD